MVNVRRYVFSPPLNTPLTFVEGLPLSLFESYVTEPCSSHRLNRKKKIK